MALPKPIPGLVIRYSYLWHSEYLAGREEGQKDRPAAIVAAFQVNKEGETRALVLPVTHSPPPRPHLAMEIPEPVKLRLGLDDAPSWVVLSEWNEFVWPGPDLRRLPDRDDESVAYGMLPPRLFTKYRNEFLALYQSQAANRVLRS